jgi:hypothetical protein
MNVRAWGVPDWTDASGYDCARWKTGHWAWQFLRRNHGYRNLWLEWINLPEDEDGLPDEESDLSNIEGTFISHEGKILDRANAEFGLISIANPENSDASVFFTARAAHMIRTFLSNSKIDRVFKDYEVGYIFDMRLPLEEQFERALASAKQFQKHRAKNDIFTVETKKVRADKYITYLRLLDAVDAGATQNDIITTLFSNIENEYPDYKARKKYDNQIKAAEAMRKKGFRVLSALR